MKICHLNPTHQFCISTSDSQKNKELTPQEDVEGLNRARYTEVPALCFIRRFRRSEKSATFDLKNFDRMKRLEIC